MPSENGLPAPDAKAKLKKEQPAWLTSSTVDYGTGDRAMNGLEASAAPVASTSNRRVNEYERSNGTAHYSSGGDGDSSAAVVSKEILETLMQTERESADSDNEAALLAGLKTANHVHEHAPVVRQNGVWHEQHQVDGDGDVLMQSDDEEQEGPVIQVRGRALQLREVDEADVQQMTPAEMDEYIKLAQEIYSHLYD